ncbi:putative monooxygenase p33MONOX isoform 1-T2 [Leptodactylus fuscus]|uniref:putative monooxygenase p33MONOX isoform X2 n=1 Tax=Leptodactylus fuscus TaxID=238119 RepID=UPI003F4EC810
MASRQPDVPAIEHSSSGLLGKMSLPIGMHRRAFSYDDALEDTAPMTPPPSDMCSNTLWRNPVIPERKYQKLSKVEDGDNGMPPPALPNTTSVEKAPVVKAKATSVIMNSLLTKHTQESIQRFEQQAGLRDAGYTPHKGLTAEETKYHRVAEALHKLKMQTGESNEEKQSSSAQSTPCSTPSSSPKQMRRSWFSQGSTTSLPAGEFQSSEMDKWSVFGPRTVQKSTTDPGGFTVQSYKGAQKPTPMELMRAQANRIADDPVTFKPPKMDMPQFSSENKKVSKGHNLKPRDMNILTPTGF